MWGNTLYDIQDLPWDPQAMPEVYTQFRKAVEGSSQVREPYNIPALAVSPSHCQRGVGFRPYLWPNAAIP